MNLHCALLQLTTTHFYSQYVDELLKDADLEQKKHLKDQLLGIWDRLIQYWVDRQKNSSFNGPTVPASAISDSIGEIVNNEGEHRNFFIF